MVRDHVLREGGAARARKRTWAGEGEGPDSERILAQKGSRTDRTCFSSTSQSPTQNPAKVGVDKPVLPDCGKRPGHGRANTKPIVFIMSRQKESRCPATVQAVQGRWDCNRPVLSGVRLDSVPTGLAMASIPSRIFQRCSVGAKLRRVAQLTGHRTDVDALDGDSIFLIISKFT
jgi:hypothetical protein